MSQSAVSGSLLDLERQFDVLLFDHRPAPQKTNTYNGRPSEGRVSFLLFEKIAGVVKFGEIRVRSGWSW